MRKQNQTASDLALEINGLIKKFLKKLLREFNTTLRAQLIIEVRHKLGLDDVVMPKNIQPPKKRRATKTTGALAKKKVPSVAWETIKPARLTKPRRTKKRVPTPAVEPLVMVAEQIEMPAVVAEQTVAEPLPEPTPNETEKIHREVATHDFESQQVIERAEIVEKSERLAAQIEDFLAARRKLIAQVVPHYNAVYLNLEARDKLRRIIALIRGPKRKKKKHVPFVIFKKKEAQPEKPIHEPVEPTLVVNQTVALPVLNPSNASVVGSVEVELNEWELRNIEPPDSTSEENKTPTDSSNPPE